MNQRSRQLNATSICTPISINAYRCISVRTNYSEPPSATRTFWHQTQRLMIRTSARVWTFLLNGLCFRIYLLIGTPTPPGPIGPTSTARTFWDYEFTVRISARFATDLMDLFLIPCMMGQTYFRMQLPFGFHGHLPPVPLHRPHLVLSFESWKPHFRVF